jgi:phosphopantetheinyl transferase
MYAAGARLFVEVGPKSNLTAFVDDILRGRPHLAIGCDVPQRSSITQLNHVVGVLAAQGVSMRLDYLYARRSPRRVALDEPASATDRATKQPSSVALSLDLPAMQISPERARALMPRPAAAARSTTALPAGQGGARLPDFRVEPGRFSAVGTALDQVARVPSGPHQVGPVQASPDVASLVMQEHLQTMERFLAVEQQIMEAFLDGSGEVQALETADAYSAAAAPPLPFIGTVTSLTPGREVVIQRRLDPDEDVFLLDHSFGYRGSGMSDVDPTLQSLPVMPFTMFIEIMAEAAALLVPGKVLTGLRQIEARQWVEVDSPTTLEITARKRATGEEVDVQIRNLGSAAAETRTEIPTVEGTVIFSDAYSAPPPMVSLSLRSERPCRHSARQMYEERLTFHGPRFQGVVSLDGVGENGILAQLQVLPRTDLFRSTTAPRLMTDPVLLDCAAQNIGTWAVECLDTGYVVFPFRLSALEIYGPMPPVSQRVRCELEVHQVTPRQVSVTMSLFGQEGRVVVRLVDWQDIRFFWPRELYDFCRFPKRFLLSTPWEMPVIRLSARENFVCQRVDFTAEHTRTITMHTIVHHLLSQAERQQWRNLRGLDIRRTEWLFGRAAAKDAVRRLVKEHYGIEVFPADVEIGKDADGRPFASLLGMDESEIMPSISIAHSDGLAVAIAGYCSEGQWLGIDIERLRPRREGFQEIAFSKDELTLLDSLADPARDEWVTRLWCAKEATAKALGKGLVEGPQSVAVRKVDAATGTVEVILGDGLAGGFPELAGVPLVVYTAREGDWVVASTLCERS